MSLMVLSLYYTNACVEVFGSLPILCFILHQSQIPKKLIEGPVTEIWLSYTEFLGF